MLQVPGLENIAIEAYIPYVQDFSITLLGIAVYSLFVFKFYRFLAKRDVLHAPKESSGKWAKFFNFLNQTAYAIKYLIIAPIFISLWFLAIASLLFILSKNYETANVLLIAGGLVGAIRLTAYYHEALSTDLAKMLPFGLLAVILIDASFFSIDGTIKHLYELPTLLEPAIVYLILLTSLEWILRVLHGVKVKLFGEEKESEDEDKK